MTDQAIIKPDFKSLSKPGSEDPLYEFLARDICPDWLIRAGIKRMLGQKLKEQALSVEDRQKHMTRMVQELVSSPVAIETASANEQHYMVPTEFFKYCLGPRLKYSCALYEDETISLAKAEDAMLQLTCERAQLADGLDILELGCGWGSLTLYMAERYPSSKITAVSNSASQRAHIESQCQERGFKNVQVITCDVNSFAFDGKVDRVVSVEMFEHMKNYRELMRRIASWLNSGGKLFVHIFSHKEFCYHYEDQDGKDWLTRNFFTGGIMPSRDLLLYFQQDLSIEQEWGVSGRHYQLTARHWLNNMDANKSKIMPILADTYGQEHARRWWVFWRLFYIACEELWGFRGGQEWMVSHYLFKRD